LFGAGLVNTGEILLAIIGILSGIIAFAVFFFWFFEVSDNGTTDKRGV
jgi:hypothetical protein